MNNEDYAPLGSDDPNSGKYADMKMPISIHTDEQVRAQYNNKPKNSLEYHPRVQDALQSESVVPAISKRVRADCFVNSKHRARQLRHCRERQVSGIREYEGYGQLRVLE